MALTKCAVDTVVIAGLGTTVDERGLTTDEFKAKFDESPTGIKNYLNNTLTVEMDTHVSDFTAHGGVPHSLYRQALINGNFDVWQRGISFASGATAYTADRWRFYRGSNASGATISRQNAGLNGSYYCARVQRNNGDTSIQGIILETCLEGSPRLRGKKLTLSFYARAGANYSPISNILNCGISTNITEDSTTMSTTIASDNKTLTTSWQLFTITTSSVVASDVASMRVLFQSIPTGTAGANDYYEITQVQLNAGDQALPFIPKSYDDESKSSLRYAFIPQTNSIYARAISYTANTIVFNVSLPVQLRTAPTIKGTVNTDYVVNTIAGVVQSGFTSAVALSSNGVNITMTKTSHGLTDAMLEIKTTSGFESEL